jgi:hypothetical protein
MSGRKDQGNERSGKEHLDDGDIAVITVEDLGEGIGVVDSKALGCANSQATVVLVECHKVERRASRHVEDWLPRAGRECAYDIPSVAYVGVNQFSVVSDAPRPCRYPQPRYVMRFEAALVTLLVVSIRRAATGQRQNDSDYVLCWG